MTCLNMHTKSNLMLQVAWHEHVAADGFSAGLQGSAFPWTFPGTEQVANGHIWAKKI